MFNCSQGRQCTYNVSFLRVWMNAVATETQQLYCIIDVPTSLSVVSTNTESDGMEGQPCELCIVALHTSLRAICNTLSLLVKCPIFLPHFSHILSCLTDFRKGQQNQITRQTILWQTRLRTRIGRRIFRHYEADMSFATFMNAPQNPEPNWWHCCPILQKTI